jgi:hypothetical protein
MGSRFRNFCLLKTRRALVLLDFKAIPIIYYCKNTSPQKKFKASDFMENREMTANCYATLFLAAQRSEASAGANQGIQILLDTGDTDGIMDE